MKHRSLILISPLVVIGIGHLVARLGGAFLGAWAWVPVVVVLWGLFAGFAKLTGGEYRRWFGPARGNRGWSILAVLVGLMPLQIFLQHRDLVNTPTLVLAWIAFAAINPVLEEVYWRGALLDATSEWPAWLAILFSSSFFALNHTLTLGVNSVPNRHPATLIVTFILGVVWGIAYQRTRTLRFSTVGHVAVDLLNLSVAAFLNLYLPHGAT